jgi:hypothetical protein
MVPLLGLGIGQGGEEGEIRSSGTKMFPALIGRVESLGTHVSVARVWLSKLNDGMISRCYKSKYSKLLTIVFEAVGIYSASLSL